jgi:MraZ protein
MRSFISRASECTLDRHGRILIPPDLRDLLNKDVILLGMDYKFEIWDSERWKEKLERINQSSDKICSSPALSSIKL